MVSQTSQNSEIFKTQEPTPAMTQGLPTTTPWLYLWLFSEWESVSSLHGSRWTKGAAGLCPGSQLPSEASWTVTGRDSLEAEPCHALLFPTRPRARISPACSVAVEYFFFIFIFFNMCKGKPRVCSQQTLENQKKRKPLCKATHHPEQGEKR